MNYLLQNVLNMMMNFNNAIKKKIVSIVITLQDVVIYGFIKGWCVDKCLPGNKS